MNKEKFVEYITFLHNEGRKIEKKAFINEDDLQKLYNELEMFKRRIKASTIFTNAFKEKIENIEFTPHVKAKRLFNTSNPLAFIGSTLSLLFSGNKENEIVEVRREKVVEVNLLLEKMLVALAEKNIDAAQK